MIFCLSCLHLLCVRNTGSCPLHARSHETFSTQVSCLRACHPHPLSLQSPEDDPHAASRRPEDSGRPSQAAGTAQSLAFRARFIFSRVAGSTLICPPVTGTNVDGSTPPGGVRLSSLLPEASRKMDEQLTCKINTRLPGSDKD